MIKPHRAWLDATAQCESTNDPTAHDPSGTHHGLVQFNLPSWRAAGGHGDPHTRSRLNQRYRAVIWSVRHGGDPWPNC